MKTSWTIHRVVRVCAGAGAAAAVISSVCVTGAARADGPLCPDHADYLVCASIGAASAEVGPAGAHAGAYTSSADEFYEESTDRDVTVDATGVTVTEEQNWAAPGWDSGSSGNSKHLGTDGYEEHGESTYNSPHGGSSSTSTHRRVGPDGFEQHSDEYGTVERVWVDTDPAGGVGAGRTYGNGENDCIEHSAVAVDAAGASPVDVRTECAS